MKLMAVAASAGCLEDRKPEEGVNEKMSDAVRGLIPLGFQWETRDPFLFCVHHDDAYPKGNDQMGPAASLSGREIGMDFEGIDGWRMYHGQSVPGFPQHPHRGFETVTIVRNGLLDHSDSLGAAARYGHGDVQWLTAGRGILHSEMFPLVERDRANPVELFQIWVNLPKVNKLVDPHFSMLWSKTIPKHVEDGVEVGVIAGRVADKIAPPPPPKSWAAQAEADFAIWTIKMAPGSRWTLPAAKADTNRTLYFFRGNEMRMSGRPIPPSHGAELQPDVAVSLENGASESELLLLQGRPIREPVFQQGPFVMNTRQEIYETMLEYQRTQFGGWPWPSDEPVHSREEGRFARHPDGKIERPA